MRPDRQTLLHDFTTGGALLRGETRVDSDHLMTGSLSLLFKNREKCAPRGIQDGLGQMMVLDHIGESQVFYREMLVALRVLLGRLEMKITALTGNLEMGLRCVPGRLPTAMRPFFPAGQRTLLLSERLLRGTEETGIGNSCTLRVRQKRLQPHIDADIRVRAIARQMLSLGGGFAHNEGIPMSIRTQDKVDRPGCSLYGSMQLDLERPPYLGRHHQVLPILMKRSIFPILPQLERVPSIGRFEARKANLFAQFLTGKKAFEGFTESISQHLDGGCGHMLPTLSFEQLGQVVLGRERAFVRILYFDRL